MENSYGDITSYRTEKTSKDSYCCPVYSLGDFHAPDTLLIGVRRSTKSFGSNQPTADRLSCRTNNLIGSCTHTMPRRKTTKTRYAIYLRCSNDDQSQGDFTTIDTQREINRRYVDSVGGVLVAEYADEGKTGTNLKRPGWRAMLAAAEDGEFDIVCCTYMSRLGRGDAGVVAEYQLKEAGVRVEFVKETFTEDTAGFVNKQVTRLVDAMYVEQVRGWTKTKMEEMVGQG